MCDTFQIRFHQTHQVWQLWLVQTADTDSKVNIEGCGIVRWKALNALGHTCFIECITHYIPKMSMPLFSPQSYFQFHQLDKDAAYYGGNSTDFFLKIVNNKMLQVPIDGPSNLPILQVKPDKSKCNSCSSSLFDHSWQSYRNSGKITNTANVDSKNTKIVICNIQ